MNDKQLAEAGLPGVGYAVAAVPHMKWPASGVQIWPDGGNVGICTWHAHADVRTANFGCTTCGWGSQPWAEWVSLAKRIIAADEAMNASN